jgi:hypothetical protein
MGECNKKMSTELFKKSLMLLDVMIPTPVVVNTSCIFSSKKVSLPNDV